MGQQLRLNGLAWWHADVFLTVGNKPVDKDTTRTSWWPRVDASFFLRIKEQQAVEFWPVTSVLCVPFPVPRHFDLLLYCCVKVWRARVLKLLKKKWFGLTSWVVWGLRVWFLNKIFAFKIIILCSNPHKCAIGTFLVMQYNNLFGLSCFPHWDDNDLFPYLSEVSQIAKKKRKKMLAVHSCHSSADQTKPYISLKL